MACRLTEVAASALRVVETLLSYSLGLRDWGCAWLSLCKR